MVYRFAFRRYRLAFRTPVRTGHGAWKEREGVIVRLQGENGVSGWGEAAPIPWLNGQGVEEVESACRALGDLVDANSLESIVGKPACFQNALRAALADFGADEIAAPDFPVAALLPAGRSVLAEAPRHVEAGFRTFKWKVGVGDPSDEISLLDDLCALLPESARLRLDANGAWDRRCAQRWLERCAERPIEFVEQPVSPSARAAEDTLRGLAADYPTPIALDESLGEDRDIERWIDSGWPGVFVVKPSVLADPAAALARLAASGAAVVFSSALETAVGARAALRTAFSWSGSVRAIGFGVWPLFADRSFDGPAASPFLRPEDWKRIDPEAVWTALS